jgi:hypothetical protein
VTKSALVLILGLTSAAASADLLAQERPEAKADFGEASSPGVPLHVDVVISRYAGEKRIGSVPYKLSVNAGPPPLAGAPPFPPVRPSQLRMVSRIPVISVRGDQSGEKASYTYQEIGTEIDCSARATTDGRYVVNVAISDSSIYVDNEAVQSVAKGGDPAVFRTFRSSNELILRDGQSTQFTAATDRVNGEVIRVDVTLRVVK